MALKNGSREGRNLKVIAMKWIKAPFAEEKQEKATTPRKKEGGSRGKRREQGVGESIFGIGGGVAASRLSNERSSGNGARRT